MIAKMLASLISLVLSVLVGATPAHASVPNQQKFITPFLVPGDHRPFMIEVHGGSWVRGSSTDDPMMRMAHAMNDIGVSVLSLTYPLDAEFTDQLATINASFNYIRSHASLYHINPNRGIIYGHSAGGHLGSILGLEGNGGRGIRGIITSSGVLAPHWTVHPTVTPTPQNRALYGHEEQKVGGIPSTTWRSFLPQHYLSPNDPPILSFYGEQDVVVPPVEAKVLRWWARKDDVHMTVVGTPGYGHSYMQLWRVPANFHRVIAFAEARLGL